MHIVFIWMNSSSQNYFCAKYNGGEISEQNLTDLWYASHKTPRVQHLPAEVPHNRAPLLREGVGLQDQERGSHGCRGVVGDLDEGTDQGAKREVSGVSALHRGVVVAVQGHTCIYTRYG